MGPTPTYSFPYPELSDPPNGPAAFQALAEAVEDTIVSTGLDAIPETLINAKGDLVVGSAADTAARLGVGSNDQVLTADSGQATGVKWASFSGRMNGSDVATVATSQSPGSTGSYVDLATAGPAVTVTVGASGIAIVTITARIICVASGTSNASVALSGANTVAAADGNALAVIGASAGDGGRSTATLVLTGLTPGSTTFTMKYKSTSTLHTFAERVVSVLTFS